MEFNKRTLLKWGVAIGFGIPLSATTAYFSFRFGSNLAKSQVDIATLQAGAVFLTMAVASLAVLFGLAVGRLERRQAWLIDSVNSNFQGVRGDLRSMSNVIFKDHVPPSTDATTDKPKWPWGKHHTKALGDLEVAARTLWTLYDPGDPSTAPTNEMVAEWLITERGVSRDRARAMASILRADGLPTGPRR